MVLRNRMENSLGYDVMVWSHNYGMDICNYAMVWPHYYGLRFCNNVTETSKGLKLQIFGMDIWVTLQKCPPPPKEM